MIDYHCLCSLNSLLKLIGSKWVPEILTALGYNAKLRFKEIQHRIQQISPTVLTDKLKELERYNCIRKLVYYEKPIRIEYQLTKYGFQIWEKLLELLKIYKMQ